jgi:hypothetical protein
MTAAGRAAPGEAGARLAPSMDTKVFCAVAVPPPETATPVMAGCATAVMVNY